MDLRQLRYFVKVAETSSISKAAAALSVAQPAISRQIQKLEDSLGGRLFHRDGRGVTLTDAGHILYRRATDILQDIQRTEWEIRESTGEPTGKVVIAVPPTVAQMLAVPLIKSIREKHPKLSLQVIEAFSGHIREWLTTEHINIALLYETPRAKHLLTEKILQEQLFLITAPAKNPPPSTIPLRQILPYPLILPSQPHGLRLLIEQYAGRANIPLTTAFEIDALSAIKELVADGIGATILPYAAVSREVVQGQLCARQITDPVMSRTLIFATTTQRPSTLATQAVVTELKSVAKSLISSGLWRGAT